ncbi:MAG: hypothetical protein ACRC8S_23375 [Fimbriiglobus sp.]
MTMLWLIQVFHWYLLFQRILSSATNDNGQVTTKLLTGDVKHWEYVYDVRGQLESAKFYDSKLLTTGGNVAYLALEVGYEYDVFGNRLKRRETVYDGDGCALIGAFRRLLEVLVGFDPYEIVPPCQTPFLNSPF